MKLDFRVVLRRVVLLTALLYHSAYALEPGLEEYGTDINGIRHVTAADAKEIIEQFPSVQVLDVRTGLEYNRGHLSNALNVNYYSFSFKDKLKKLDKGVTWLVHCRTGVRSSKTLPIMKSLGFTSVIHLDGGTSAWTSAGYDLQKD